LKIPTEAQEQAIQGPKEKGESLIYKAQHRQLARFFNRKQKSDFYFLDIKQISNLP
jgi:hypothetical protein